MPVGSVCTAALTHDCLKLCDAAAGCKLGGCTASKPIRVPSTTSKFAVCSACTSVKTPTGGLVSFNCANTLACTPTGCTTCERNPAPLGDGERGCSTDAPLPPHAGLSGFFITTVTVNLPTGVPGKTSPVPYRVCAACKDPKCAKCTATACLTCKAPAKLGPGNKCK